MADERLRFFLDLIDKVTAPASRIAKSMRGMEGAMKAVDKVDKGSGGSRIGRAFASIGGRVSGVTSKIASFGPGLKSAMGGITTVAGGLWGATKAGLAFGAVGLGVVAAGAGFAIGAASFKRNMLGAFELMLGSKEEAAKVFKEIDAFADETPFEAQDVFATFKSLNGSGLNVADAKKTMMGIFDIASLVDPSRQKNAIDSITLGIAKIQGEGKLTGEAFNMITEATDGFAGKGLVLEEIAKALKVTKDQASSMISKGLVPAKVAIEAYQKAISKGTGQKDGALGGAMAKFGSGSLEGQMATFQSRMASLFEDIDIQPLITGISKINDGLKAGTPAGDALRNALNAIGGEAGAKIAQIFTAENISKFVSTVAELVPMIFNLSKAFGSEAFGTFWAMMKPLVEMFSSANGGASSLEERVRMLGQAMGAIVGVLAYIAFVIGAIAVGFYMIGKAVLWVIDQFAAFVAWWHQTIGAIVGLGAAIVNGILTGIQGAWPNLKAKWNELVGQLPAVVGDKLKIASPSRVMQKLGVYTVQGFTKGIDGQAANTNAAMANAVTAPTGMAAMGGGAAAAAQAGGGGKGGVSIGAVHVTVDGGGSVEDAKAKGEAAADGFRSKLATILDELDREAA